ncbi:uncharacterized protein LOC129265687 [Lytechinus pictus]|uniref:uncharacterized protein LOC129265687 n=1 Tax=Lytechinus pictus TaxID=7653 RepID=UPI00240D2172|nr:uncharacterized protein LOC129265687 [Lytechinus pictus]
MLAETTSVRRREKPPQFTVDRRAMIIERTMQQPPPPEYATFVEMKHMAGKVAVLREKTWELYTKQMTLEKSFTTTGDGFSQLKSRVSSCHSVSVKLKKENCGIEREVGELRGGMRSLAKRADTLNKRLDEIDQLILIRKSRNGEDFKRFGRIFPPTGQRLSLRRKVGSFLAT